MVLELFTASFKKEISDYDIMDDSHLRDDGGEGHGKRLQATEARLRALRSQDLP